MYTLITAANSAQAHQLKNRLDKTDIILGDYEALPAFMLKADNELLILLQSEQLFAEYGIELVHGS